MARILIAGFGNLQLGDDAFGVEVVRRLRARPFPSKIGVHDFGTRCLDLAYCLLDEWDAAILVAAAARGLTPGTLSVLDLADEVVPGNPRAGVTVGVAEVHHMARRLAIQVPGRLPPMYLVACEPLSCQAPEGLTAPIAAAIDAAVQAVLDRLASIQAPLCVGSA